MRFLNLAEQEILAAPFSAAVFSAVFEGCISGNLILHALAWHGSVFFFGSAFLIYRQQKIKKRQRWFSAAVFLFALTYFGIAADALLYEPTALTVRHLTLMSPKITKPVKIVFLADIQTDNIGDYERRMLQRIKEQNADLVFFGGDYIQGKKDADTDKLSAELRQLILEADLHAPLGMFAVDGNHEYWSDSNKIFNGTGIQLQRRTSSLDIGEIRLTFLGINASFNKRTIKDTGLYEKFWIILGHAPMYALAPQSADLMLAGHTHGGQVQIPFYGPPITHSPNLPRSWASGVTKMSNGSTLLVTNGIGMERGRAPRVRFLCRPDFWVIDLVPE